MFLRNRGLAPLACHVDISHVPPPTRLFVTVSLDTHTIICTTSELALIRLYNQETAQKYEVFQMPTFLLMRKGEVVEQFSGANAAVLRQKVEALLGNAEGGSEAGDEGEDVGEVGEEKPDGEVEEEKPNFEGVCEPEVEDNAADSEA